MFGLFNKKKEVKNDVLQVSDKDIVAIADGELIDVTTVSDPVFAQKLMGESTAFRFTQDKVTLCAPANGTLSVLFPTGHAFGVTMKDGTELLVHCGINTVEANGDGFKVLKKQGDSVHAGDAVIEVNLKKLNSRFDMSTMLIVTNSTEHPVTFIDPKQVVHGEIILK